MSLSNMPVIMVNRAAKILEEGGVILYPTEGVYGLGCDPFNETAVKRILKIKRRCVNKGLILIAANWRQTKDLIGISLSKQLLVKLKKNKEPTTWVFPATKKVPRWITGKFNSVAIRVTSHPVAKKICQKFGGAIVSTSANLEGAAPAKKLNFVNKELLCCIDLAVDHPVGVLGKSTRICDILTGRTIRV